LKPWIVPTYKRSIPLRRMTNCLLLLSNASLMKRKRNLSYGTNFGDENLFAYAPDLSRSLRKRRYERIMRRAPDLGGCELRKVATELALGNVSPGPDNSRSTFSKETYTGTLSHPTRVSSMLGHRQLARKRFLLSGTEVYVKTFSTEQQPSGDA
jgi:hypothetical protein